MFCDSLVNEWLPVNDCPVHPFRDREQSLSSCTPRESALRARMKLESDKKSVVESWNQFLASLSSAFVTYSQARRVR